MAEYIQNGVVIDFLNTTGAEIKYKDIVTLGTRIGIAAETIPAGKTGGVKTEGIFEVEALNTEEFAVGDVVYLNADNKATKTKGSLTVIVGWVVEAKPAAKTTVRVKL